MARSWIQELSPELFWDVRQDDVDPHKHLRWVVERVLTGGSWNDWRVLEDHVPIESLRTVAPRLKVAPREKAFLASYLEASRD